MRSERPGFSLLTEPSELARISAGLEETWRTIGNLNSQGKHEGHDSNASLDELNIVSAPSDLYWLHARLLD